MDTIAVVISIAAGLLSITLSIIKLRAYLRRKRRI